MKFKNDYDMSTISIQIPEQEMIWIMNLAKMRP